MLKRFVDFSFSLLGLIILSPFLILIALAIKLGSSGPIFYLQSRVGKDHVNFELVKFRTMVNDADKGNAITVGKRDSRITRVGYFLREFKLDELPQLVNVIKGDMSLVGPRPELKKFVDSYSEDQKKVLSVRPGITDHASIEFRNENELLDGKDNPVQYYVDEILPKKLSINLAYLDSQSIFSDIGIIVKTLRSIFKK